MGIHPRNGQVGSPGCPKLQIYLYHFAGNGGQFSTLKAKEGVNALPLRQKRGSMFYVYSPKFSWKLTFWPKSGPVDKFWQKHWVNGHFLAKNWIYVMIYEDGKIECGKWRATISATLDTATIPGTTQTLMTALHVHFEVSLLVTPLM